MVIVDDVYDLEGINILAAHALDISPRVRQVLEEHWAGTRSKDFMHGLLVGYANGHAVFTQQSELAEQEAQRPVSTLAAFVAEKLLAQLDSQEAPDDKTGPPPFPDSRPGSDPLQ